MDRNDRYLVNLSADLISEVNSSIFSFSLFHIDFNITVLIIICVAIGLFVCCCSCFCYFRIFRRRNKEYLDKKEDFIYNPLSINQDQENNVLFESLVDSFPNSTQTTPSKHFSSPSWVFESNDKNYKQSIKSST